MKQLFDDNLQDPIKDQNLDDYTPLADRLRPKNLDEVLGQDHLLKNGGFLHAMRQSGKAGPMILWGAPGCGKTTIARLLADEFHLPYIALSAIFSGVKDLKNSFEQAKKRREMANQSATLLFIDEIHRFNKAQQDAFLPVMEDGTIILVGATTENPSFELNNALLSRLQVLILNRLDEQALAQLLQRAEEHYQRQIPLTDEAKQTLIAFADGDGRRLLNFTQSVFQAVSEGQAKLDKKTFTNLIQQQAPLYDKNDENHYNLISALHKSLRGSDVDAALYWFARMLEGGEDMRYIARRLMRFAYEDVGMADPNAALQAEAASMCYHRLGSPEGEIAIAQLVIYLATAPKSNGVYQALKASQKLAKTYPSLTPPKHILNAPTKLMKEWGYGTNYKYDHNEDDGFSGQNYFPDDMERQTLYAPKQVGFERDITKRLNYWHKLRQNRK